MKIIRTKSVDIEERGGYRIRRLATETLPQNAENLGLYETIIPQGSKVGDHAHQDLKEVLLFLTECRVETDEGTCHFDAGDFLVLEAGEFHEIHADRGEVRLIAMKLPNLVGDRLER